MPLAFATMPHLTEDEAAYLLAAFIVAAVLVAVIAALGVWAWQRNRDREAAIERASMETALKERMVQQGMSADDICRILSARIDGSQSG